jgi:hypothetical protein
VVKEGPQKALKGKGNAEGRKERMKGLRKVSKTQTKRKEKAPEPGRSNGRPGKGGWLKRNSAVNDGDREPPNRLFGEKKN